MVVTQDGDYVKALLTSLAAEKHLINGSGREDAPATPRARNQSHMIVQELDTAVTKLPRMISLSNAFNEALAAFHHHSFSQLIPKIILIWITYEIKGINIILLPFTKNDMVR